MNNKHWVAEKCGTNEPPESAPSKPSKGNRKDEDFEAEYKALLYDSRQVYIDLLEECLDVKEKLMVHYRADNEELKNKLRICQND